MNQAQAIQGVQRDFKAVGRAAGMKESLSQQPDATIIPVGTKLLIRFVKFAALISVGDALQVGVNNIRYGDRCTIEVIHIFQDSQICAILGRGFIDSLGLGGEPSSVKGGIGSGVRAA